MIAVVPVEVSAGASGALGIKATVSVNSKFEGTVSPFVDVGAYAARFVDGVDHLDEATGPSRVHL